MSEPVTSGPSEPIPDPPSHHPTADQRADAALRELVRLLARIVVAEALGAADVGEEPDPDRSA